MHWCSHTSAQTAAVTSSRWCRKRWAAGSRCTEAVGRPRVRHGSTLRRAAGERAAYPFSTTSSRSQPLAAARCTRSSHRDVWHHRARRRSTRRPTAQRERALSTGSEGDGVRAGLRTASMVRFISTASTSVPRRARRNSANMAAHVEELGYSAPRIDARYATACCGRRRVQKRLDATETWYESTGSRRRAGFLSRRC